MRPIATDTNDFPKLREKGCIYVDKTEYVHRMVSDVNTSLFFISRPRRFGKSLPPPENFGNAIESLSAANGWKGVVILIDEYATMFGYTEEELERCGTGRKGLA